MVSGRTSCSSSFPAWLLLDEAQLSYPTDYVNFHAIIPGVDALIEHTRRLGGGSTTQLHAFVDRRNLHGMGSSGTTPSTSDDCVLCSGGLLGRVWKRIKLIYDIDQGFVVSIANIYSLGMSCKLAPSLSCTPEDC